MPPMFPKSISDVQYIYPTSNIYIRRPISISDIRVPMSDIRVPISNIRVPISDIRILHPTSDIYIGRPIYISDVRYTRARARAGISDVRYRYRTSNIYIGHPILISETLVAFCLKRRLILQGCHFRIFFHAVELSKQLKDSGEDTISSSLQLDFLER